MSMAHRMVRRLEQTEALDGPAKPLSATARRLLRPRRVRNLLSGTNLGHPLHPFLTDVTIGAWSMSTLLDAVGGPQAEPAADLLVRTGVVAAVPTALAGVNDWADTLGAERRVGLVHAAANSTALTLYISSMIARARGDRRRARNLGLAGFGVLAFSGYLGGHLAFARGVGVNRTAWQQAPEDWTPVLADTELAEGMHRTVAAGGVPVLLHRAGGRVQAMAATCSHMGGPLGEGAFAEGCVTCPWHGSTFRLDDGAIVRGPASAPQPCYETRIRDGRIEIRVPQEAGPAEQAEGAHAARGDHRGRAARRRLARTS